LFFCPSRSDRVALVISPKEESAVGRVADY
jgi:hypothetical protein